jgi:small ligand-binding sensory domain FIST
MNAFATVVQRTDWREAVDDLLKQLAEAKDGGMQFDAAFLFASAAYSHAFSDLITAVQEGTGAATLIGCSGWGVIGPSRELEGVPALSVMAFPLPGATLHAAHISQSDIESGQSNETWRAALGVPQGAVNAWFIFADPFTTDAERLLAILSEAYPGVPLVGGLASGDPRARRTHIFLNGTVYGEGAVVLALGGAYTVRTVVSQGCEPIGEPWTITGASGHLIESIGMRPAYEVLLDTVNALPAERKWRARGNLFVGLAIDEYRDRFGRGDFLIRNLLGADPEGGALAVGAQARVGQTVQFQLRDPKAADEDLRDLLEMAKRDLISEQPIAALLCACNGRGTGLFGRPDHDARLVAEKLGPIPLAGFFCNGEIGPVGSQNFLHGYTASIALIVPKRDGAERSATSTT